MLWLAVSKIADLDYAILEEKFNRHSYKLEILNEENNYFSVEGKIGGEEFKICVGTYLMNRVFFEFLSPHFIYEMVMDSIEALATKGSFVKVEKEDQ